MASKTDSEMLAAAWPDHTIAAAGLLSGVAAAGFQILVGFAPVTLMALMVLSVLGLVYRLNLRLVAVLHRQRKRSASPKAAASPKAVE